MTVQAKRRRKKRKKTWRQQGEETRRIQKYS
jgi:hypothetical protein